MDFFSQYISAKNRAEKAEEENKKLRELLVKAEETIQGLAEQQAMYDGWYVNTLSEIREALEG